MEKEVNYITDYSWFKYFKIIPVIMILPLIVSCVWSLFVLKHPSLTTSVIGIIWLILAFAVPVICYILLAKNVEWLALTALFLAIPYVFLTMVPLCWGFFENNCMSPVISRTTNVKYYKDISDFYEEDLSIYIAELARDTFPDDFNGFEDIEYESYNGPWDEFVKPSVTVRNEQQLKTIEDSVDEPYQRELGEPFQGRIGENVCAISEITIDGNRVTYLCLSSSLF